MKGDARTVDRLDVALDLLQDRPPGRTPEQLRARWPDDAAVPKPSERTLRRDLEAAFNQGSVRRTGDGAKGDPFRYYHSIPDSSDSYTAERPKSSRRRGFRRKLRPKIKFTSRP
jgi:hypothetical protein